MLFVDPDLPVTSTGSATMTVIAVGKQSFEPMRPIGEASRGAFKARCLQWGGVSSNSDWSVKDMHS